MRNLLQRFQRHYNYLKEIATVHIKEPQKGKTPEIRGNNLADHEAKDAAENGAERVMLILILTPNEEKLEIPKFRESEKKELEVNKINQKWKLLNGRQLLNKMCLLGKYQKTCIRKPIEVLKLCVIFF